MKLVKVQPIHLLNRVVNSRYEGGAGRDDNGHRIDGRRCERHDESWFFNDVSVGDDYDEGHPLVRVIEGVLGFKYGGGDGMDVRQGGAGGDGSVASICCRPW